MRLSYDDDFVEASVFLCARGQRPGVSALQIRRFHAERERCYALGDPDERGAAFFELHLAWFREWGLEKVLLDRVAERPLLNSTLTTLAFRRARGKQDEAAELYLAAGKERNGVVALKPERLQKDEWLFPFLRHELFHLHDMVDPAFGYSTDLTAQGVHPSCIRVACERYRLLWDITIDGRLGRAEEKARHAALLDRAYSFWTAEKRAAVFSELWEDTEPRHERLLALAADPRDLRDSMQPAPGALCPACGFSTFEWADAASLNENVQKALAREFPHWNPSHGVCGRCAEVYAIGSQHLDALPQ